MLHLPWLLLETRKKRCVSFSHNRISYPAAFPSLLRKPVDVLTISKTPSLSAVSLYLAKRADGILKFSSPLQMELFTKLLSHFPSHPFNKSRIDPLSHSSSKTTLPPFFLVATSFATQPQKILENMMKQLLSPTFLLLIFFLNCTTISAQSSAPAAAPSAPTTNSGQSSPPALAPSSVPLVPSVPSGPSSTIDITAILKKARNFNTFIGLLKSTQMDAEINTRLKKSDGLTVFAPTDSAFSNLQTGALNSFSDRQKTALARFHIILSFIGIPQFQTVSNPIRTAADGSTVEFPLNVIGNGTHVNMTTGLVNTTVDSTVYSDGQLAVYEIGQVLIAPGILGSQAPAPAPLPPKPKKATPPTSHAPPTPTTASVASSGAARLPYSAPTVTSVGVSILAALPLCL